MMIALKKFAAERNEQANTVATYIRRHAEQFAGHTRMDGKKMFLDEEAVRMLNEVYPLPKPIEVIQDTELLKKYADVQDALIRVLQDSAELREKLALVEKEKLFLEFETTDRINDAVRVAEDAIRAEHADEIALLKQEHQQIVNDLEQKLAAEKEKPWWKKIF